MKAKKNYYAETFGKKNEQKKRGKGASKNAEKNHSKNAANNVVKAASKSSSKSTAKDVSKGVSKNASKGAAKSTAKGSSKSVQKSNAKCPSKNASKRIAKPGTKGASKTDNHMQHNLKNVSSGKREFWQPGNMLYPLPAVMVSCCRKGEKPNIITVAWTGTVCSDPAMVFISVRKERYSYDIIKETGEFVINLTTDRLARATDLCGVKSGRDIDKFKAAGLTPKPSKYVGAPYIAESPVSIECRVSQIIPLGSHDMFIADVLGISIDSAYLDSKGKLDLEKAGMLVYSHGEYHRMGDLLGTFGYSVRKKHY